MKAIKIVSGIVSLLVVTVFFACKDDFVNICDDNIVPGIDMGCIGRSVFSHENHGNVACQTANDFIGSVNKPPFLFDFVRLCHVCFVRTHHPVTQLITVCFM